MLDRGREHLERCAPTIPGSDHGRRSRQSRPRERARAFPPGAAGDSRRRFHAGRRDRGCASSRPALRSIDAHLGEHHRRRAGRAVGRLLAGRPDVGPPPGRGPAAGDRARGVCDAGTGPTGGGTVLRPRRRGVRPSRGGSVRRFSVLGAHAGGRPPGPPRDGLALGDPAGAAFGLRRRDGGGAALCDVDHRFAPRRLRRRARPRAVHRHPAHLHLHVGTARDRGSVHPPQTRADGSGRDRRASAAPSRFYEAGRGPGRPRPARGADRPVFGSPWHAGGTRSTLTNRRMR